MQVAPGSGAAAVVTVELGKSLGADGHIAATTDKFKAGEPIFVVIDATTIKVGTGVRLTWVGPQGTPVSSEELLVPPDARLMSLKAKDTTGWAPGTYRVDITVAGTIIGSKTFTIE